MKRHDELQQIHNILLAVGDCPPIADSDPATVRMLKGLCLHYNRLRSVLPEDIAELLREAHERLDGLVGYFELSDRCGDAASQISRNEKEVA